MPLGFSSLPVTIGQETSRAGLDQAAREYLGWYGDPLATLAGTQESDPDFMLGGILTGVLRLLSGENPARATRISALALGESPSRRLRCLEPRRHPPGDADLGGDPDRSSRRYLGAALRP